MAEIKKYPTKLHIRCQDCMHQGIVEVFLDKPLKLICSKCKNRDPIVTTRDTLKSWSNQRLKKNVSSGRKSKGRMK
jgi:hypothetical protein